MTTPELEAQLQSYPPALLVGSASPNRMRARTTAGGDASPLPAGGAQTGEAGASQAAAGPASPGTTSLLVDAGTPGAYTAGGEPVPAGARPRNLTELRQLGQPNGRAPWDAGQYVPVGGSGKRAHWTGEAWAGGESPGYTPADTQFPGDDTAEDQHR